MCERVFVNRLSITIHLFITSAYDHKAVNSYSRTVGCFFFLTEVDKPVTGHPGQADFMSGFFKISSIPSCLADKKDQQPQKRKRKKKQQKETTTTHYNLRKKETQVQSCHILLQLEENNKDRTPKFKVANDLLTFCRGSKYDVGHLNIC